MIIAEDTPEEDVLLEIAMNTSNPSSIMNCVTKCRQNGKGIRPSISTELWENTNAFYHFVQGYDRSYFKSRGLYDFVSNTLRYCSMFKALADSTLLHDDSWHFIRLGIHMERSSQITRILSNKLYDIQRLNNGSENRPMENYQWLTTLKILEGLDMSRKVYNKTPERLDTCEFLISNVQFPRSIAHSLEYCHSFICRINRSHNNIYDKESLEYKTSKMAAEYKFLDHQTIDDLGNFLDCTSQKLIDLNQQIVTRFFQH